MKSHLALAGVVLTILGASELPADDLSEVFARVSSSVVVVRTRQKEISMSRPGQFVSAEGLGSGVLISADGRVLTAAHVVQAADAVAVMFPGGEVASASVVSSVPAADVALLQVDRLPASAMAVPLGDSDKARVGEEVFVVGAPFGITHTLTVGHLSARRRPSNIPGEAGQAELLQTDAAINQGNSGGPMFNMAGEVIGIVSHIISRSGGFEGLGFAVSSNMARKLLLEEKSFWSGMEGYLLSGEMAEIFNLPQPEGLLVLRVAEGSPAQKLGLKPGRFLAEIEDEPLILGGDVVLEVAGVRIGEEDAYKKIRQGIRALEGGGTVRVKVMRAGKVVELAEWLP